MDNHEIKKMVSTLLLAVIFIPAYALTVSYDPLKITQPSIAVVTEQNGYIGIESGTGGDIHISPGANNSGSVYLEGEDLLFLIQVILSKPPVWENINNRTAPFSYLGEFRAGQRIAIELDAMDPEGTAITYQLVAGDFPPGIRLFGSNNKMIGGIIPDTDATYTVTIRATDGHGKYADAVFRMVVRGRDSCQARVCKHEGVCVDTAGDITCTCVSPYGGKTCNLDCRTNPLGIQQSLRYVTDAQMTSYRGYTSSGASYARVGGSSYWYGRGKDSYVQIDFGNETEIHRVATQRGASTYYTSRFYLTYSMDGNNFQNYTSYTGDTVQIAGSSSTSTYTATLPTPLRTRYVRVHPISWYSTSSSYYPALKLEMYGCYSY